MKDGFIKVSAITPQIKVADPAFNAEQICTCLDKAYAEQAKIIVFPELCITGYTCQDLFLQQQLLYGAKEALNQIIVHTAGNDALVFVGLPLSVEGKLYNVAAVLSDGHLHGFVPKTCIPNYGEFYEVRHFTPAPEEMKEIVFGGRSVPFGTRLLFTCKNREDLVIGCEICEDVWSPDPPSTSHALAGATVIVNLSASNETVAKAEYRRMLIASTSARLVAGYIYCSAGEGESTQDLVFSGHDLIAENGTVLAESKRFAPGSISSELDLERIAHDRRKMNTYPRCRDEGYVRVPFSYNKIENTKLTRFISRTPFVPGDVNQRTRRCEEIFEIQAGGLKKRLLHTHAKTAVIGVSGGLDSTLALLVTARAFDLAGKDNEDIIAVTMPCFGTTDRTYQNALSLAKALGCTLKEVDIRQSVTQHFADIGQDMENHDVTYENGQARERTQVLMDLANKESGMVIGTGDMSELALGWATYNGDHMSMYGVNAGVPKTLVRHLVDYVATSTPDAELSRVLKDVLATPVSPELLPPVDGVISQKTEDLVGPYELHDFFLYYLLRFGFDPAKIYRLACIAFFEDYDRAVILKWLRIFHRRFFAQQFKRSCLPDGPKVGSVAVSPRGDLRMPSDASNALWMREIDFLDHPENQDIL